MANIMIKEIEDAMIAAVENKCKKGVAVGGYVRTVDTYSGELWESLEALTARFPAVLFEMTRIETRIAAAKGTQALGKWWEFLWNMYVLDQDLRGKKRAKRDTGGTYDMIEDVTDALDGKILINGLTGIDVKGFEVIDNLPAGEGLSGVSAYVSQLTTSTKHRTEVS